MTFIEVILKTQLDLDLYVVGLYVLGDLSTRVLIHLKRCLKNCSCILPVVIASL